MRPGRRPSLRTDGWADKAATAARLFEMVKSQLAARGGRCRVYCFADLGEIYIINDGSPSHIGFERAFSDHLVGEYAYVHRWPKPMIKPTPELIAGDLEEHLRLSGFFRCRRRA